MCSSDLWQRCGQAPESGEVGDGGVEVVRSRLFVNVFKPVEGLLMFLFRRVEPVVLIKTFGMGVLFALLSSFAPAALSQTHCSAAERSIFSCEIGRKVLSLCSSPDLDDTKGWLQYRFGTLDKLDLVFPEGREHPKKHFRSLRNYSSVEQALIQELGFKKGNTGYTVYREDVKGKKEAGV